MSSWMACIMRKHTNRYAFTMIELVAAVAVLALGLLPLLWMLASSHENTRETVEEFIGTNVATEVMESLQTLPYESLEEMENVRLDDPGALPPSIGKFGLQIPRMPQDFKILLSVKKIGLRNDLPDCGNLPAERFSRAVKERTAIESQPFLIDVRVEWGHSAPSDCVRLVTVKGCY